MGKIGKVDRIYKHLQKYPNDYQSVIAFYKARSEQIAWERKHARIPRLRLIAECRKKAKAVQDGKEHISE